MLNLQFIIMRCSGVRAAAHRCGSGFGALVLFFLLLSAVSLPLAAQHDVSAAGGMMGSAAGTMSYTCGQAVCGVVLSPVQGSNAGNMQQGVHQPYPPLRYDTLRVDACDSFYWSQTGVTYTRTGSYNSRVEGRNGAGILTLQLRLHPSYRQEQTEDVCDSFVWDVTGITYRDSASVVQADTTRYGCDSIHQLTLTVRHSSIGSLRDQAFREYTWYGMHLTECGIYHHSAGRNSEGCDSTVHLTLAIMKNYPMPLIVCYNHQVVMVDHYPGLYHPGHNAAAGLSDTARIDYAGYRWYHNGTLLPLATDDLYSDYSYGRHQELHGCYYVEVPVEAGSPYWVSSNTICMELGIDDVSSPQVNLYPNPVASGAPLQVATTGVPQGVELRVYDMRGRLLVAQPMTSSLSQLALRAPAGVYSLVVHSEGATLAVRRFIVY